MQPCLGTYFATEETTDITTQHNNNNCTLLLMLSLGLDWSDEVRIARAKLKETDEAENLRSKSFALGAE
jgi:hypothetical protein